jgi:FkbM family methyltransferase
VFPPSTQQIAALFENWREVVEASSRNLPQPTYFLRNGLKISHAQNDDADWLINEIFLEKTYSLEGFYKPKERDTILDIGSNIGIFTLYLLAQTPKCEIHCFEPARETRSRLKTNIEQNGFTEQVVIHPYAIFVRQGKMDLILGEQTTQHSLYERHDIPQVAREQVQCMTLDEAVERSSANMIELVKLDVEGAELDILQGTLEKTWKKINRLVLEYHDKIKPCSSSTIVSLLRSQGFHEVEQLKTTDELGIIRAARSARVSKS